MPQIAARQRPTALVIGAGAAGLLAAAALADHADVTVLERDVLPDGPEPRRGVPQSRHAHLVWSGGVAAIGDLVPGALEEVTARGGRLAHAMRDIVTRGPSGVWFRRFTHGDHRSLVCSRDLLDSVLRNHVLNRAEVTARHETTAVGLEGDLGRVTGVRVRTGGNGPAEESVLHADLVVDASGRGSRAPRWLTALGLPEVAERSVNAGLAYATRLYRAPGTTAAGGFPLVNVQADPTRSPGQGGILLPVEGDRWIVTLSGTRGGEPTADPEAFIPFALGLGDPLIGELLKGAEPLGDVVTTRSTANRRRYYERMRHWPEGFVVLGDAAAGYNPVYAHGLTVAAQCGIAVREVLDRLPLTAPGTAKALQTSTARPVGAAWDLAVGQDAFYPGATGTPPTAADRLRARFVDRALATGANNPRAQAALLDVMSLRKPPGRLFSPDLLVPMLLGPKRPPLGGPPLRDDERERLTA
ncbi:FAD-dependent monooxygenase [Streptomyces sp. NPDC005805]|uniref:NAD(P)/FAD-dependent oxidoreductase n=1 Tax=Streptomyces sp. NPDC005805 TaxID=3157068 RepID=UPI0033E1EB8C